VSFYASHIITAAGSGGMLMVNDKALALRATMFRDWGRIGDNIEDIDHRIRDLDGIPFDIKFTYGVLGYNMKAGEVNAAFGLAQLRKLPRFLQQRRDHINRYVTTLRDAATSYILPADHKAHDWLAMPLQHEARALILPFLERNEVQTRVFFAGNVTRHPAFRHRLQAFAASDVIMERAFLLGAHHGLEPSDVDRVCDLLIRFDKNYQPNVPTSMSLALASSSSAPTPTGLKAQEGDKKADVKAEQANVAVTAAAGAPSVKKVWYAPHKKQCYGSEEIAAVVACLEAGWLAPGPLTAQFEQEVSRFFGKAHGVMTNSGSSANLLALAALQLPPGSEIITPACTFATTVAPIEQLGLVPVFVDVLVDTYVPDVETILQAITPNTKV
jgi:dTDP-4-amino-4,6-dideoxygalactose transaminase